MLLGFDAGWGTGTGTLGAFGSGFWLYGCRGAGGGGCGESKELNIDIAAEAIAFDVEGIVNSPGARRAHNVDSRTGNISGSLYTPSVDISRACFRRTHRAVVGY